MHGEETPSLRKKNAWKKAEAEKRRTIIKAKTKSWENFITNLNTKKGHKATWAFTKAMSGRNFNPPSYGLQTQDGSTITDPKEKATLFMNTLQTSLTTARKQACTKKQP